MSFFRLSGMIRQFAVGIAAMTIFRLLVLGIFIGCSGPVQAQTSAAKPTVLAPATPGKSGFDDAALSGPGGLYRIIATSTGVLMGAGAMSLFIDGWVVETFMQAGGLTTVEAMEVVQDFDSQAGLEAAAVVLSGLAGGLVADAAYLQGTALMPGVITTLNTTFRPPLVAINTVWTSSTAWVQSRYDNTADWFQARSREFWDQGQMWLEQLRARLAFLGI